MATLSNNDIAKAIFLSAKGKTGLQLQDVLKGATSFLAKKRLLGRSPNILKALERISNEEAGRMEVNITGTERLGEPEKKQLRDLLKKRYGDKEYIFKERVDERLVGGIKIQIGDEVIDLTLKKKIHKLQEYLTRN